MESRQLIRGSASVDLVGTGDVIQTIMREVLPYYSLSSLPTSSHTTRWGVHVTSCHDSSIPNGSQEYRSCPSSEEPPRLMSLDSTARTIYVRQEQGEWAAVYGARAVRNLLRWQLLCADSIYMHGGGVSLDDKGIAILGCPRSGKTLLLFSLLALSGARYMTDNEVLISANEKTVLGWPSAISLRRDILRDVFRLVGVPDSVVPTLRHPANWYTASPSTLRIFPSEIHEVLGFSPPNRSANLSYLLFPTLVSNGDEWRIARLEPELVYRYLLQNWDVIAERKTGVIGPALKGPIQDWNAITFEGFLADLFPLPLWSESLERLRSIATLVPAYEIYFGFDSLKAVVARITSMVRGSSSIT